MSAVKSMPFSQAFKKGEAVKVNFERRDGTISRLKGKFVEIVELGRPGEKYGVVRFSKSGSIMTSLNSIERTSV